MVSKAIRGIAALSITAGCVSACGGQSVMATHSGDHDGVKPAASALVADTEINAAGTEPTKPFGTTFTGQDGVSVTVSRPTVFTPSSSARQFLTDRTLEEFVMSEVTIKNDGQQPLDAITISLTATTGRGDAEAVFDAINGIDHPTSMVMPGASSTYKAAWARNTGADFVVAVHHGFGGHDVYYR